jgi:hypothetical protein
VVCRRRGRGRGIASTTPDISPICLLYSSFDDRPRPPPLSRHSIPRIRCRLPPPSRKHLRCRLHLPIQPAVDFTRRDHHLLAPSRCPRARFPPHPLRQPPQRVVRIPNLIRQPPPDGLLPLKDPRLEAPDRVPGPSAVLSYGDCFWGTLLPCSPCVSRGSQVSSEKAKKAATSPKFPSVSGDGRRYRSFGAAGRAIAGMNGTWEAVSLSRRSSEKLRRGQHRPIDDHRRSHCSRLRTWCARARG